MKYYFSNDERTLALRFHAAELVGTPFAAHAMAPGDGIDCVHVNAWVYLKTGFLKQPLELPAYNLDEGTHGSSKLVNWIAASGRFELVWKSGRALECWAGDTVCFATGKSEYHVGLMLDGARFVHVLAMQRGRVIISDLRRETYYNRRARAVYRPLGRSGA